MLRQDLKLKILFVVFYVSAMATAAQDQQVLIQQQQQQQQQINYGAIPPQNWVDPNAYTYMNPYGQWENVDPNYKGYDNRRGGYRKQGGRNYNNSRGRGNYRGQGYREGQNNRDTRKRRDSGGNPSVLQFTSQHFPPLPSQDKKESGYKQEFKKYDRQEMIDIVSAMKVTKPDLPVDGKIVLTEVNTEVQMLKPWPKKPDQHIDSTTITETATVNNEQSNPHMSLPVNKESSPNPEDVKKSS